MLEIFRILAFVAPALALSVVLADAFAAPRGRIRAFPRSLSGTAVLLLVAALAFAVLLTLTGAPVVSGVVVAALVGALSLISNIKRRVLGEPLVFSDFALIGAVFQHPQFYFSALRPSQLAVLSLGLPGLVVALALMSSVEIAPRLAGLMAALGAGSALALVLRLIRWPSLSRMPDPEADVLHHGLTASLLVHWHAWRHSPDPAPCDLPALSGESGAVVVIVQCESFTDPSALFGEGAPVLDGLKAARALAWRQGRLMVSGFGAYTMRTEFGVLFGRDEEELGTRRFDPLLTAHGETSWALPNRLDRSAWTSWFVHPHDMRFYGRHRLMPQAGFSALVGEDTFARPAPDQGRYISDAAVADRIMEIARGSAGASFIYAVTIENHGPWSADGDAAAHNAGPYLRLLARSDAMLARLLNELPRLGRPAILCFFGDHRPSIPGASDPGEERHTPYVLIRFAADGTPISGGDTDLNQTPAQLHHAILEAIRLGEAQG